MHVSSWSGGKDSCLALHRALKAGLKVSSLVNFISADFKRVRFHGTPKDMIGLQAGLMGINLLQKETTADGYEDEFKSAVRSLLSDGIKGMVFGDIYLDEHRQWVERVCAEMGISAVEPLWNEDTEKLLLEFIASGFEAVVVSGEKKFIDKDWIGKKVDKGFLKYIKGTGADICGEKGEYHTFVTGGPIFKGRIEITESSIVEKNSHWLLDIKEYKKVS